MDYTKLYVSRTFVSLLGFILFVLILNNNVSIADEYGRVLGRAFFSAEHDSMYFRPGVSEVVFDTSACNNCKNIYPAYRFIYDLKVDSIRINGVMTAVTEESQMDSIYINSESLCGILDYYNIYSLNKVFPLSIPNDTLVWDRTRLRYNRVGDLSKSYYDLPPD